MTRVVFLVLRLLAVGWERLQKARKMICRGGNGQQGEGKQQRTSLSWCMLELRGGGGKEERKQRTVTHNLDSDDKGIGLLTCCLTVRSDSVQPTQQKRGSIGVIGTTVTDRDENQFLFRQPIEQLSTWPDLDQ